MSTTPMDEATREVLTGERAWHVVHADVLTYLRSLPDDSCDLIFGSPPYEDARTYGMGFKLRGQDWVDWMVSIYVESLRVCQGVVGFVVAGRTRGFNYSATPEMLTTDLKRAGVCLMPSGIYHRPCGIPGGGGPDRLRNDYEFIICATRGGRLPWSDNKACGNRPKYRPGGAMSHRRRDGSRVNGTPRKPNGRRERQSYTPPPLVNPGNVITIPVGGGRMGSKLAHQNVAPFPEQLPQRYILSFCPPGGVVGDPFSGSGTTGAVAVRWRRRFIGCDLDPKMVQLSAVRISNETSVFPLLVT
jgi:hypothetical protein